MSRRRHHLVERLSVEAQQIVEEGLLRNLPYQTICDRVKAETDEEIGTSSISRYYTAVFSVKRKARLQANEIAARLVETLSDLSDQELQRAIKLRATEALMPVLPALADEKPGQLAQFVSMMDSNRVQHARIEQRREEIEARVRLTEQKLEIERSKIASIREKAASALKKAAGPKTPAAVRKAIADIYGITVSASSEAQAAGGDLPSPPAARAEESSTSVGGGSEAPRTSPPVGTAEDETRTSSATAPDSSGPVASAGAGPHPPAGEGGQRGDVVSSGGDA